MTDRFTVRAVVVGLIGLSGLGMCGLIYLVGTVNIEDAGLLAIIAGPTGTALGGLVGMLARTSTGDDDDDKPQEVEVVNRRQDPVPTISSTIIREPDVGQ